MDEYIRKQDAVEAIGEEYAPRTDFERGMVSQMSCDKAKIKALPPADVVPVRHGKWTKLFYDGFNCNKCGSTFVIMQGRDNMYYCPNCGAKMDAQGEE